MRDQLKRRERPLASKCYLSKCYLCEHEEETIKHLLMRYQLARMLWEILLAIIGMRWVFSFLVSQALLSWEGAGVDKKA